MKFHEIIKQNRLFSFEQTSKKFNISVIANIAIDPIKPLLEYNLRSSGINAHVSISEFDNYVQESTKQENVDMIIIFWELIPIIEKNNFKVFYQSENIVNEIYSQIKKEVNLVIENLKMSPVIIFNKFLEDPSKSHFYSDKNLEFLSAKLNLDLEKNKNLNLYIKDLSKIIMNLGVENVYDKNSYYRSSSLYTLDFLKEYCESISPIALSLVGKAKKVLVLDCDNTLWKGILGEDGEKNIEVGGSSSAGRIFFEIQSLIKKLCLEGIILSLCTKNNLEDIENFFNNSDLPLNLDSFAVIKSNWNQKDINIKEISEELNVGLDSIVFLDDSDFEINLVKKSLPEVECFKVPEDVYTYVNFFKKISKLFYNLSSTSEDINKTSHYKIEVKRKKTQSQFKDIEDYLKSLDLKISSFVDRIDHIPRASQMSQKTNQFNLTTRRYSENEIKSYVEDSLSKVFTFNVEDKFGDYGITALAIIKKDRANDIAHLDTFLMSCRILGRNLEKKIISYLIDYLKKEKFLILKSSFIKSNKNSQVENFYDNLGFKRLKYKENFKKEYSLILKNFRPDKIEYIKIQDGR